jgi:hypothetical protein
MIGAGKYDATCSAVLIATEAEGVVLIVLNGVNGTGMSVNTTDAGLRKKLPDLLRVTASMIEAEHKTEGN